METKNNKKFSILAIDDEPEILNLISTMFNETYEIAKASQPEEAINITTSNNIDLVICDFNLINYCALDVLKAFEDHKINTPFIIFSSDEKDYLKKILKLFEKTIIEVVEKPRFNELKKVVYGYFKQTKN